MMCCVLSLASVVPGGLLGSVARDIFSPSLTFSFFPVEFSPCGRSALFYSQACSPALTQARKPGVLTAQPYYRSLAVESWNQKGPVEKSKSSLPTLQMKRLSLREQSSSLVGAEVGIETRSHTCSPGIFHLFVRKII